jgi:hypothetical protein
MLVFGVLVFAIVTFFVSFLIVRTGEFDKGKVATYITLIAWGSMGTSSFRWRSGGTMIGKTLRRNQRSSRNLFSETMLAKLR